MTEFLRSVVDLFHGYGPGMAGYMLAILALGMTLFVCGYGLRAYNRHMTQLVHTSESLRASMMREREQCEQECRRLREITEELRQERDMLIRMHSQAREEFLQEARERELIQGRLLAQAQDQERALEAMRATTESLRSELEAIRKGTRGGGG